MLRLTVRRLSTYIGKDFMNPPAGQLHDPTKILGTMDMEQRKAQNQHQPHDKNAGRPITDILRETEKKDQRREARNPDAEEANARQPSTQWSAAEQRDDEELMEDRDRNRQVVEDQKKLQKDEKGRRVLQGKEKDEKPAKTAAEIFSGGES